MTPFRALISVQVFVRTPVFKKQKVIEDWLNIKHSNLKLSSPLCFERWIRDLEMLKSSYGRSNPIFIMRFVSIYGTLPVFAIFVSIFIQIRGESINCVIYCLMLLADIVTLGIIYYVSRKICRENKVAYKIEKEYLNG